MTRSIPLYGGKHVAIVDDEDFERISKHRWSASPKGVGAVYAFRRAKTGDGPRTVMLHREVLNVPDGTYTDHIDGNPLNNTRSNLRLATPAENAANRKRPSTSTTGFKGVGLSRSKKKFRAVIGFDYQRFFIGQFDTAEDAALAYDDAAILLFGPFARLNFPETN